METIQSLIAWIDRLQPERVTRTNHNNSSLYSTPVIDAIEVDGLPLSLSRPDGKYAALYVRCSSEQQKRDGFNLPDQVSRTVKYCIEQRLAFRLFTDATISGHVTIDDDRLQAESMQLKAYHYEQAYRTVFMSGDVPPDILALSEKYLAEQSDNIARGRAKSPDVVAALAELSPADKSKIKFRPAMTALFQDLGNIHVLVATDWSRISRNHILSMAITSGLKLHKVGIVGVVESLDAFSGVVKASFGSEIMAMIMSMMAAYYLQSLTINILRGFQQMLSDGFPNGPIPAWCTRDQDGRAHLNDKADDVRKMIDLFLAERDGGYKLAAKLDEAGIPSPTGHKYWTRSYIRPILESPTLLGYQEQYGRRWKTLPALIDEDTYNRIQILLAARRETAVGGSCYGTRNPDGYLLTSVMKCWCGSTLVHHPHSSGGNHYICVSSTAQKTDLRKTHGDKKHIMILQPETDDFFESYLISYVTVGALSSMTNQTNANLKALEEHLQRLRLNYERDRPRIESASRCKAALIGIDAQSVIDAIIEAGCKPRLDEIARAAETVRQESAKHLPLELIQLTRVYEDPEHGTVHDVTKWTNAPTKDKNAWLRLMFRVIQFAENDGETLARPILHDGQALPAIRMITKSNKRSTTRRWPDVLEAQTELMGTINWLLLQA